MDQIAQQFIKIIVLLFLFGVGYAQNVDINQYMEVSQKRNGMPYTDKDVDGKMLLKENGRYYKKKLNSVINPLDFGAKGDGISDDSQAFISALNYASKNDIQLIEIKGDYVFNLKQKTIDIPGRLTLKFLGGILKNGKLIGNNTSIVAEPVRIFDDITLAGTFIDNASAYVEWYGTFPNDINSVDLKHSLQKLNAVFFNIKLNSGIYYTKIGNIHLKGIKGVSQNKTFIELNTNESNTLLFHIGKVGDTVAERTYESNSLESVGLVLSSSKKVFGNALLVVGASHKSQIRDVKFIMNSNNTSNTHSELVKMTQNESLIDKANVAIVFDGSSELTNFDNIFTLSDIGIKFNKNADFVNINNYTSWNGNNGFSTVYFKDTTSSNIIFSGNQSWSQGVYGVYARNATGYNNFVNVKFENLRIEQLNPNIKDNDKVIATSFRFGDYIHLPNLNFTNVMLAGTANGFRFGKVKDGRITIRETEVFYDKTINREYALAIEFQESSSLKLELFSAQLPQDITMKIQNGKIISDEKGDRNYWGRATIIQK